LLRIVTRPRKLRVLNFIIDTERALFILVVYSAAISTLAQVRGTLLECVEPRFWVPKLPYFLELTHLQKGLCVNSPIFLMIADRSVSKEMGTFAADELEHLADVVKQVPVIDRLDKFNLTEVTRAVDL